MSYRLPNWRYEEIKYEVAKMFIKCNIKKIPINGFEITNKLAIKVIPYSAYNDEKKALLIEEDEDGFYIKKNGEYFIYYNDDKVFGRINFTILHEIGHIILDHTQHSQLAEAEANFFAKYAIAPPILVDKYCSDTIDVNVLLNIYENFSVTKTAGYNTCIYYLRWKRNFNKVNKYEKYENMILEQFE